MEHKCSDSTLQSMETAALGRPLYPGMLYDCRSDAVIPGVTLWNKTCLGENLDNHPQVSTKVTFSSSDSVSDKCNLLNISASLKASFLGGLVEVDGAAKYLSNTKSSNQQSRVTMFYSETSTFSQLTMAHLGNITYPEFITKTNATHVVTAVLYGAQASMVFDQTFSDDDNQQDIDGELNVMVKKIPFFSMEGHGAVKMNNEEKTKAEKISCTFYGDFRLEQSPTTYLEAVEIYKKLPSMLKDYPQNVVPLRVWLCPLSQLDSSVARLEREVSSSQMFSIENIIEELAEVERSIRDLFNTPLVIVFSDVKDRLKSFQSSCRIYKTLLLKEVSRVLPAIRGGEKDNQELWNIVEIHYRSPFNEEKLKQWIEDAKSELLCLKANTGKLDKFKIDDQNGLSNILLSPDVDVVVSYTFTSLQYDDLYLSTLKEFVKCDQLKEANEMKIRPAAFEEKWFSSPEIAAKMRDNLSLFMSFTEANKSQNKICFTISTISDSSSPGSAIYLYEKGRLTDKQFRPVSRPPPPIIMDVQDQAVFLKLQKSPSGETVQFKVEVKEVTADSRSVEKDQWMVLTSTQEDFTLTGLEPEKSYSVRYRTVGKVGVSEASEEVCPTFPEAHVMMVGEGPGAEFCSMTLSITTIRKITVFGTRDSYAESLFKRISFQRLEGIQVKLSDGYTIDVGRRTNYSEEFEFDRDDKIISATLWSGQEHKRLTGLQFVVEKPDGSLNILSITPLVESNSVNVDVKSGKCYGLKAKVNDAGLVSLGFFFI